MVKPKTSQVDLRGVVPGEQLKAVLLVWFNAIVQSIDAHLWAGKGDPLAPELQLLPHLQLVLPEGCEPP